MGVFLFVAVAAATFAAFAQEDKLPNRELLEEARNRGRDYGDTTVPRLLSRPDARFTPPVNRFEGRAAVFGGQRAWPGAPPVIPHSTLMRTDCLSCHGPGSYPGLRTDHPQRRNCVQCHAGAAALDQTSPFFTGSPPLLAGVPLPPAGAGQGGGLVDRDTTSPRSP